MIVRAEQAYMAGLMGRTSGASGGLPPEERLGPMGRARIHGTAHHGGLQ